MERILIVDDDPMIRLNIKDALEDQGYTCFVARDGKEALEMFNIGNFDCIITDIYMPNKEGVSVIQDVRRISKKIKIIAMSGASNKDKYLATAKEFGANDILSKPFSINNLLQIVKCNLENK